LDNLTPKEIVAQLDKYVIGQREAKKTIAVALRNRYRRMQLDIETQRDIVPKNILMIGDTGVGKTEIARRLARMMSVPFLKIEASKYTEVGFVGRDVESMIRDLANVSLGLVKKEEEKNNKEKIEAYVENKIIEQLLPPLPNGATDAKRADYDKSFAKMQEKLENGKLDHLKIKVDIKESNDFSDSGMPTHIIEVQESISKVLGGLNKNSKTKEVSVKEAKILLAQEATNELFDNDNIKEKAKNRVEEGGIIFLDEIDKIAVAKSSSSRQDPGKEGVQRDLLPIVEGSNVNTKLGMIKTDHILFIAAGAFHVSKPSDLIPELQGRFPLRVELDSLDEDALHKILTQPQNSMVKQYQLLLGVEKVELIFQEEALRSIAKYAFKANEKSEDIGARRLHTIMEKILEDISFDADEHCGETITIDEELVTKQVGDIVKDEDATRYIL